jgi:hypothetical protein
MDQKENSPFTPGCPVPVELFVGRADKIKEIIRYIKQASNGKQENVFLSGARGIGKTSIASYLRYYTTKHMNMIGVHVFLGKAANLDEAVRLVFEGLLKEIEGEPWFDEVKKLFGRYVKQIGLFGISIGFNPPIDDLKDLVANFPQAIDGLLKKIGKNKKGLFIALDDINGLSEKAEFANWYKSFVDEVATHFAGYPVFIMLIGRPENRDGLYRQQQSLMRVFRVEEIAELSDKSIKQYIENAFKSVDIKVEKEALESMVQYSSGLPLLMHEIGDAVFWADKDGVVDEDDFYTGLINAADNIGKKYLDPKVYRAIRSPNYRSILRKLGSSMNRRFLKHDVEDRLSDTEKKVFHNFLRKMKELGVIESDFENGKGAYKYVNEVYPVYIYLESYRKAK